jgi:heterodisulfide reductase subunit A
LQPNVVSVKRHEALCTKAGQEFIKNELQSSGADRVVVAACTPRTYEEIIRKGAVDSGINKNLYEQTGIREQCEWIHSNKGLATSKAISLVNCAVAKVSLAQKVEDEDIEIKSKNVLIIGGGVAGMQAAKALANKGVHCYLIESDEKLGGMAQNLSASVLEEHQAILPNPEEISNNENIEVFLNSTVKNIQGWFGNYTVTLQNSSDEVIDSSIDASLDLSDIDSVSVDTDSDAKVNGDENNETIPMANSSEETVITETVTESKDNGTDHELKVGGIIIATGSKVFDANRITEFRYDDPDVITSLELEKMLGSKVVKCPSNDATPKRINFIQCVGSRDDNRGNSHCSLVCCTYAIRQAMDIKALHPEAQVYVHYMDLRGPYPGFEEEYREAQAKGIQFIRGRTAEIQRDGERLVMRAENVDLGEPTEWDSDLIVLSVGQEASEGTKELADMLHIPLDIDGFLGEYNYHWDILDRRGISIAGCAQGPRDIKHALRDANRSANEIGELFEFGAKTKEVHSVIDQARCTGCAICEALCPYNAISMIKIIDYEMEELKQVSNVDVSTCQACGACAMACPSNVPLLSHLTADQIIAEIETVT